ncbi:PREDICTED: UPF0764 protein C16orf89 homolog [Elephantulus edwardii]|uniref:UPF0764 protein C16orf89 homolog n=1 Tax=Elephantulus edwardii TaxID=28737 RepID=UPI0003F0E5B8|nr:PREDICTED: UPF0764 protein C16orf89 homolog [Elephantulus edwardii]
MRLLFLLLLMTSSPRVSSSFVKPDSPEMKGVVSSIILSSLEQAVIFLEKDYTNTEVNDMVSLRILQVELKAVQKIWIKDPLFRILNQKVEKLIEKLDKFIGKSINKLKLLQPTYVQAFHPLLKPGFWQLPCQWIRTNTSMIYDEIHHEDAKVLDVRDNCIVELLASRINEDWSCSCSHSCETLVTKLGASNYYLSYQLRYFLFSKMLECSGDLFQRNKHYMDLFCANMMKMNQDAELNGYTFPDHGLFMTNSE